MSNQKYFGLTAIESLREDYMRERALLRKKISNPHKYSNPADYATDHARFKNLGSLLNKLYLETHGQ